MKPKLITQTYVVCPNCGEGEKRVDHLFDQGPRTRPFGTWYCEECGHGYDGTVDADNNVDIEITDKRKVITLDLLVMPPQSSPVYFVVEGMRFPGLYYKSQVEEYAGAKFWYEENTSLTNFIPCEAIISKGVSDPHGLFELVRRIDRPADCEEPERAFTEPFEADASPAKLSD